MKKIIRLINKETNDIYYIKKDGLNNVVLVKNINECSTFGSDISLDKWKSLCEIKFNDEYDIEDKELN